MQHNSPEYNAMQCLYTVTYYLINLEMRTSYSIILCTEIVFCSYPLFKDPLDSGTEKHPEVHPEVHPRNGGKKNLSMVETPRRLSTVPIVIMVSLWCHHGPIISPWYPHIRSQFISGQYPQECLRLGFAWKWGTVKKWQSIWVYKEAAPSMMVGITGTNQPPRWPFRPNGVVLDLDNDFPRFIFIKNQ